MKKRILYCPEGNHYPKQAIADSDTWDNETNEWALGNENIGIIVDSQGRSTGIWADGTVGVPKLARIEAENDEEPKCKDHPDSYCEWRDVDPRDGSDRIPEAMERLKSFEVKIGKDEVTAGAESSILGYVIYESGPTVGAAIDALDNRLKEIWWNN